VAIGLVGAFVTNRARDPVSANIGLAAAVLGLAVLAVGVVLHATGISL
jgi:hypothetical protein